MAVHMVNAIVRFSDLKRIEDALARANVRGITVTGVKGYGEYKNFFTADWKVSYARMEIFTARPEEIADIIVNAAHTGNAGDGIVAISPVEKLIRIRNRHEVMTGEE